GARFLRGLSQRTDPGRLAIIGNTGDDEELFGLHVAPDLDTVLYTLTGRADPDRGWGLAGEPVESLRLLGALAGPGRLQLADPDLATRRWRPERWRAGWPLSRVTHVLGRRHRLRATLLPMTDDRVRTFVHTELGRLPFQTYLVRHRGRGHVRRIEVAG